MSDVDNAYAFLNALRERNDSGYAVFGNITVGRTVYPGPNMMTIPKQKKKPVVTGDSFGGDDLLKLMNGDK